MKQLAALLLASLSLLVACASQAPQQASGAREAPAAHRTPLIVDDDGSLDGVAAMVFLSHSRSFETKAWTVSPGESHPRVFAPLLARLQAALGIRDVPIAAGPEAPLSGDNTFPEPWRSRADRFWDLPLPAQAEAIDPRPAPQLIVEVIRASPEPVVVEVTGPLTNLASALRLDPSIRDKIGLVQVMGGAIHVTGNIHSDWPANPNTAAEWNIYVDPVAAEEVFGSGVPIRLMSLDATNRILFYREQVNALAGSRDPSGRQIAAIIEWELKNFDPRGVFAWDLATAVDLEHPELSSTEVGHVDVITSPGPTEGQTVLRADGAGNVSVCSRPDANGFRRALVEQF